MKVKNLQRQVFVLQQKLRKAENTPDETAADDLYLDEGEWKKGFAAAQGIRRYYGGPGLGSIKDMSKFVDGVSESVGIYWSPEEKAAFRSRYSAYYANSR
jgi:hypothetical protein